MTKDAETDCDIEDPETLATNSPSGGDGLDSPAANADSQNGKRRTLRRLRLKSLFGTPYRQTAAVGAILVVAFAAWAGWLGWVARQHQRIEQDHFQLLQAARQGALNLTTIDWQHADREVQRILDSATGTFYDDFADRKQSFIDVVKQTQSKSEGTITGAGLESASENGAQVLVALSVNVSNAGAAQQNPRSWRMRLTVTKSGENVKVENVEFVP